MTVSQPKIFVPDGVNDTKKQTKNQLQLLNLEPTDSLCFSSWETF